MRVMYAKGSLVLYLLFLILSSSAVSAAVRCPIALLPAYAGNLEVQSKYDPDDPSRSIARDNLDSGSEAINEYLNRFSGGLGLFSDYYVARRTNSQAAATATQCMHDWLGHWADADALTTADASPTGVALRVWALSAVASAVLKLEHFAGAEWTLSPQEKAWIARLSETVRADYESRIQNKPERINNHDYWAAWAVAASAIVTEDKQSLSWSYTVFRFAMSQTVYDAVSNTAYLPNELGRGKLGAHYTNFAVTPLVMLAKHLPEHGYSINYQDMERLKKLADFAAVLVISPSEVAHLVGTAQQTPSPGSFVWLYPFNAMQTDIISTQDLLNALRPYIGSNQRLGGDIRPVYD